VCLLLVLSRGSLLASPEEGARRTRASLFFCLHLCRHGQHRRYGACPAACALTRFVAPPAHVQSPFSPLGPQAHAGPLLWFSFVPLLLLSSSLVQDKPGVVKDHDSLL